MKFNPGVFRKYDVRGRADVELTDEFVTALGRAYGTRIRRDGGRRVALGRDCRTSGARVMAAFQAGIRACGVDVLTLGVVPTPLLYFALHHFEVDGGVVITGSHNPPNWNGFKLCQGRASMYGDQLQALRAAIETNDFDEGEGGTDSADVYAPYHAHLADGLRCDRALKVVIDAGNGTGGLVAGDVYRALGHEVIELFCEPDGAFPNHHPDPTVEANLADLKAAVAEHGADVGIAFDGDADRIGAVDHRGRVVWGDQMLLFFAREVLRHAPGATIVSEVKCSRVLFDGIAEAGGVPDMWKVGHSLIKARMKETGALLAGEMSGHIFFADRYFGFDDAVYVGARLLELLANGDASLADMLDGLPATVTTPELRVACSDEAKFDVVDRAVAHFASRYEVCDLDGARIDFAHGWGLVRSSNTQPALVMRFEADTQAHLSDYRDEVEGWLRSHAPEVDLEADTHH